MSSTATCTIHTRGKKTPCATRSCARQESLHIPPHAPLQSCRGRTQPCARPRVRLAPPGYRSRRQCTSALLAHLLIFSAPYCTAPNEANARRSSSRNALILILTDKAVLVRFYQSRVRAALAQPQRRRRKMKTPVLDSASAIYGDTASDACTCVISHTVTAVPMIDPNRPKTKMPQSRARCHSESSPLKTRK